MNRLLISLAAMVLLLPGLSSAGDVDWIKSCQQDGSRDLVTAAAFPRSETTNLKPGQYACAESITATEVTDQLKVSQCNHVDVFQYDDPDGDADISTVVGQVQICPDSTDDDDSCSSFGLTEFSGDSFLEGLGATYIRIEVNGTTDTAPVRWEVRCVGSSSVRPG